MSFYPTSFLFFDSYLDVNGLKCFSLIEESRDQRLGSIKIFRTWLGLSIQNTPGGRLKARPEWAKIKIIYISYKLQHVMFWRDKCVYKRTYNCFDIVSLWGSFVSLCLLSLILILYKNAQNILDFEKNGEIQRCPCEDTPEKTFLDLKIILLQAKKNFFQRKNNLWPLNSYLQCIILFFRSFVWRSISDFIREN